jgi:ubiquinone/menaquinone biosynthesis C-methylase UbiE
LEFIKKVYNFLYYWHPKIALRYLPIAEEINQAWKSGDSILEVGSGPIGIAPYLGKQVIGVDTDFSGKECQLLKQVVGDGTKLQFSDKSFDYVVSTDVLEHIPPAMREQAIQEWLRVAKKELIIAFPEGEKSEIHDKTLYENFKKKVLSDFSEKFFKEHLENGLPKIVEVKSWIKKYFEEKGNMLERDKQVDIVVINNLNLSLRQFLMSGWMTKNPLVDLFFRKILLFFIPILRLFNNNPTYRKIIFVKIK